MTESELEYWRASRPRYAPYGFKYAIVGYKQDMPGYQLYPVVGNRAMAMESSGRVVGQRGLARLSWTILAGKIINGWSMVNSPANGATRVSTREGAFSLRIEAENILKYIGYLNDKFSIIEQAFSKASSALERELSLRDENWVKSKWRRMGG